MKKLLILGLLSASTAFAQTSTPEEMLNLINQARAQARQCGNTHFSAAKPLKWNDKLEVSARLHAEDMAKNQYFEHDSQDGRTPFQRMNAQNYDYSAAAENISAGRSTAKSAIEGWLKSPGHCANLMSKDYTEVGMGYGYNPADKYQHYWVQNFGTPAE